MRTALVTGGTRGIGRAVCDMLAGMNFSIAFAYNKSADSAEDMLSAYQARGINCIAVQADLGAKDGADRIIDALRGFPKPDTLINNAGGAMFGLLSDSRDEDIERLMNLNFHSPLKLIRALSRDMVSKEFGRIVNITSMWALVGSSGESVYSASKAALDGLTKSLAKELGGSNITVNSIAPGLIDTDMNRSLSSDAVGEIVSATPLGRMGTPHDIAEAVRYLIGENLFMTGATLNLSGGFVIT